MKTKMTLLTLIPSLFITVFAHSAELKCSDVLSAMSLTRTNGSLGLAGAMDVTDAGTGEKARIYLSQTSEQHTDNLDNYSFSISFVNSLQNQGALFQELDQNTNFQLLEIRYPGFSRGCEIGVTRRQMGANTILSSKSIQSVAPGKVILAPTSANSMGVLRGQIQIEYHGPTLD